MNKDRLLPGMNYKQDALDKWKFHMENPCASQFELPEGLDERLESYYCSCPCCDYYLIGNAKAYENLAKWDWRRCAGCPIGGLQGEGSCFNDNSPYSRWISLYHNGKEEKNMRERKLLAQEIYEKIMAWNIPEEREVEEDE